MINAKGLALIKEFEGCKLDAYQDIGGVWTIGYGHTKTAKAGMRITQLQADQLLAAEVSGFAADVIALCDVTPNDNQWAALTSLAYNIGVGALRKSTVLRMHNAGKHAEAAAAFSMWNKAGGKVRAGLTRRRAAEASLYLTPVSGETQTTRATPDTKDPAAKFNPGTAVAAVGGGLAVAQQAVAQVSEIWDGLAVFGVSPHLLLGMLGVASIVAIGWFVWEAKQRRAEGDL